MKKLSILSLALATLAGCASSEYGHTASDTGSTFKMVKTKPANGKAMGSGGHQPSAN